MATVADIKARIKAIVTCPEAQGREAMADHLAFKTEMIVDQARRALACVPAAVVPTGSPEAYLAKKMADGALGLGAGCPVSPIGSTGSLSELKAERIKSTWSKAVAQANAKIGVQNGFDGTKITDERLH